MYARKYPAEKTQWKTSFSLFTVRVRSFDVEKKYLQHLDVISWIFFLQKKASRTSGNCEIMIIDFFLSVQTEIDQKKIQIFIKWQTKIVIRCQKLFIVIYCVTVNVFPLMLSLSFYHLMQIIVLENEWQHTSSLLEKEKFKW